MTPISTSTPINSYLGNAVKTASSNPAGSAAADKSAAPSSDPIAQLRSYAQQLVSHSQGGLLRAYQAQHSGASSSTSSLASLTQQKTELASPITLPDVADLPREDAATLMQQIDKLLASDPLGQFKFVGFNGEQQTESLSTYRTWLQDKGGISIHV